MPPSQRDSVSPSLDPRSPSPYFSAASQGEYPAWDSSFDVDPSTSRAISPTYSEGHAEEQEVESVTCLWEDCGRPFLHLQTLIEHIHNLHIGVNKSTYTCEWSTCPRRGMQQASRFALISHIRAHTGEKPFTCPLPQCDKSFTRSDAMAKHMRLQHNISPPLPGRGGSRKRKRDDNGEGNEPPYASFKVESGISDVALGGAWDPEDPDAGMGMTVISPLDDRVAADYFGRMRSISPDRASSGSGGLEDRLEDGLPARLIAAMDPKTGKILGRSPAMVKYLIMKAKHKFVLEQHAHLLEELRVVRTEERRAKLIKEEVLNQVLGSYLGAQAEFLIRQPQMPSQQSLAVENYTMRIEENGRGIQPY